MIIGLTLILSREYRLNQWKRSITLLETVNKVSSGVLEMKEKHLVLLLMKIIELELYRK
jgi:hypothetical protein